jgi:NAD(P)-dependent dehydrogenase (short-subunit alcohol dehydrogenase family)
MSKGAIKLLTYSLAHGLGVNNIRVNSIHPGVIETNLTTEDITAEERDKRHERLKEIVSLGRVGKPEEVGDVAVFLASDLARYVTGESVVVDGGWISNLGSM